MVIKIPQPLYVKICVLYSRKSANSRWEEIHQTWHYMSVWIQHSHSAVTILSENIYSLESKTQPPEPFIKWVKRWVRMLVCFFTRIYSAKSRTLVFNSAGIWRPHRVESIVLAIYPALSLKVGGGGEIDQQKFDWSWRNSSR
jgi:hypothetical protein